MQTEILMRCWPEMVGVIVSLLVIRMLVWQSGASLRIAELRRLHRDQVGGVQTLSFVLTVPLFIFVMMFIVQLSQITIAKVVVEYASFSAARSAAVWIPATTERPIEGPNRISFRALVETEGVGANDRYYLNDDRRLDVASPSEWANQSMYVYEIAPGSPKYEKIWLAAAMACVSISPSREVEVPGDGGSAAVDAELAAQAVERAYLAFDPTAVENSRIPVRLRNKINYALANTEIELHVRHRDSEPPLWVLRTPWNDGWEFNEIGWQDQLTVKVTHHFALLPGPGRLLARRASAPPGTEVDESYAGGEARDRIARQIAQRGDTYTYAIESSARLVNQGHIPTRQFVQSLQNR